MLIERHNQSLDSSRAQNQSCKAFEIELNAANSSCKIHTMGDGSEVDAAII